METRWIAIAAVVVCICFSPSYTKADTWLQKQNLNADDGMANDYFGYSVSISGDYAIVGAYGDENKGTDSGSIYIFKRTGPTWAQTQMLTAADGAANDFFGYSVSISGDYAIVGAYGDDNKGADSGSIYIFKRDGALWAQTQMLTAADGAAGDYFGYSVSISGDYAIVGAYGDNNKGADSGSVYIFKRDGLLWAQTQMLTAADGAAGDFFGGAVSISGDYAVVGAYGDDNNGADSGSIYILKWDGVLWTQTQMLTAADGAAGDSFGCAVSVYGDYAIAGAYRDDNKGSNSGSAYIFNRNGAIWAQQQLLTAADGLAGDSFGFSVSISSGYASAGAIYDDTGVLNCGSAYIFKQNGTTWPQQQKLGAADASAGDFLGNSVSISTDCSTYFMLAGAHGNDNAGSSSGSLYVYGFNPAADLNNDNKVDLADFAILTNWWLYGTE